MTTQVVGEAAVNLRLDTEQYEQGFEQAERTSRSRGSTIRRSAVAVSGALAGIGLAGAMMAEQNQKAFNAIAAGTGASGDALRAMEQTAVEIAGTVPQEIGAVATVIADLNTTTGITGETLQSATEAALLMSETLGTDANATVAQTGQLLRAFNRDGEDAEAIMLTIGQASQETGVDMGSLSQRIINFSGELQDTGLTLEGSIALMNDMHASGLNITRVMPQMQAEMRALTKEGASNAEAFAVVAEKYNLSSTEVGAYNEQITDTEAFQAQLSDATQSYGRTVDILTDRIKVQIGELFNQDSLLGKTASGFTAVSGAVAPMLIALPTLTALTSSLGIAQGVQAVAATAAAVATSIGLFPIIAIVLGIGLLIGAIILVIKYWDEIKEVTIRVMNIMVEGVELGINQIIGYFNKFIGGVNTIIGGLNKVPGVNIPLVPEISDVSLPRISFPDSGAGGSAGSTTNNTTNNFNGDIIGDFPSLVQGAQDKLGNIGG